MKRLTTLLMILAVSVMAFGQVYDGDKLPSGLEETFSLDTVDYMIVQKDGETYVKAAQLKYLQGVLVQDIPEVDSIDGTSGQFIVSDGTGGLSTADALYEGYGAFTFGNRGFGSIGNGSLAFGFFADATKQNTIALGYSPSATDVYATSIGYETDATGHSSMALMSLTLASGEAALATGFNTEASGDYSAAFNYQTTASGLASFAGGYQNYTNMSYSAILTGESDTIYDAGGAPTTEGSIIVGGYKNYIESGDAFIGGGSQNRIETTNAAHSFIGGGADNVISENHNVISGGYMNESSSSYSAIGGGYANTASGSHSTIAGGFLNEAFGQYSFCGGGTSNEAIGKSSTTLGQELYARSFGETTIGLFSDTIANYGDTWDATQRLFTIGNGTSISDRSNSLVMLKNGNTTANGTWEFETVEIKDTSYSTGWVSGELANDDNGNLMQYDGTEWLNFHTKDLIEKHVAQYHRIDSMNIAAVDTWEDIKFDTVIANETTGGFDFNADSTGYIYTGEPGIMRVQGCVHWDWEGGVTSSSLYVRVLVDGVEARCLQASEIRTRDTGDKGVLHYAGTINVDTNSTIDVQWYVTDADMVLEGDTVFDNPVAASVNFEYMSKDF